MTNLTTKLIFSLAYIHCCEEQSILCFRTILHFRYECRQNCSASSLIFYCNVTTSPSNVFPMLMHKFLHDYQIRSRSTISCTDVRRESIRPYRNFQNRSLSCSVPAPLAVSRPIRQTAQPCRQQLR